MRIIFCLALSFLIIRTHPVVWVPTTNLVSRFRRGILAKAQRPISPLGCLAHTRVPVASVFSTDHSMLTRPVIKVGTRIAQALKMRLSLATNLADNYIELGS